MNVGDKFFGGLDCGVGHNCAHIEATLNLDDKTSDRPWAALAFVEGMIKLATIEFDDMIFEVDEKRIKV